jgi:hypothetical protein
MNVGTVKDGPAETVPRCVLASHTIGMRLASRGVISDERATERLPGTGIFTGLVLFREARGEFMVGQVLAHPRVTGNWLAGTGPALIEAGAARVPRCGLQRTHGRR